MMEKLKPCPHFKEEVKHTKLRIEIRTDCFKNQEFAKEKGWYRKFLYCPVCDLNVRTETWDDQYMFGMSTVLKNNEMPKHCPDCGQALDWSDTMTDRERLVERIQISVPPSASHWAEVIADELLADGWMRPPCKVGTTIYQIVRLKDKTGFIVERKVVGFHIGEFPDIRGHERSQYLIVHHDATNSITHIDIKQIGKTVFLSREEAEKALRGGGEE